MEKFWERYGKMVGTFFAGLVLGVIAWGAMTDWNFTSDRVIASTKPTPLSAPKNGDSCTTPDGKPGKVQDGKCTA